MTSLSCTLLPSLFVFMYMFIVLLVMFMFIVSSFVFMSIVASFVFVELDAFVAPGLAFAGFVAPTFAAVFVAPVLLFFDALVLC